MIEQHEIATYTGDMLWVIAANKKLNIDAIKPLSTLLASLKPQKTTEGKEAINAAIALCAQFGFANEAKEALHV